MNYCLAVLLVLALVVGQASAEPVKELSEFTETQVLTLTQAINDGREEWEFRKFLLRIIAKVGFDLDAIKLELLPELELVWQKEK